VKNLTGPPAGHITATYHDSGTYFYLADWLGSKRVELGANGCATAYASLPYGDGLTTVALPGFTACAADATEHYFTGKERDAESGNDYFGARYYASSTGRWLSPDWSAKEEPVPYATLGDPQSLNLYAYVRNNPLMRVDADGHCWGGGWCDIHGTPYQTSSEINAAMMRVNSAIINAGAASRGQSVTTVGPSEVADANSHASYFQGKYEATSDGDERGASFDILGNYTGTVNYSGYNFIQYVTTDTPAKGKPANSPYNDQLPGAEFPYYYPPDMQKAREAVGRKSRGVTVFEDNPHRPFQGMRISWHAELSFVGIRSDGTYDTLWKIRWGFTVNAKGKSSVDPDPIQEVQ